MNDLLNLSSLSVLVAVLVLPITSCRRTDSRLAVMNIPAEVTCAPIIRRLILVIVRYRDNMAVVVKEDVL